MRSRTAGFSLIEVLVAIVILGTGLVGMSQAITSALTASRDAELYSTAVLLASGRMEEIMMDPYLTTGEKEGTFETGFSGYRWKTRIEDTRIEGLMEATVLIEHGGGSAPVYELKTLVFVPPGTLGDEEGGPESLPSGRRREGAP